MFLTGLSTIVKTFVFLVFLLCSWCVVARESLANSEDEDSPLYSDTWLDPGDMLSTDFSSFTASYKKDEHKLQPIESEAKKAFTTENDPTASSMKVNSQPPKKVALNSQPNCDLPHFKQLTRIILESFPTPGKRDASIELSNDDLKMLREFKENDREGELITDVLYLIIGIFKRLQEDERLDQTFLTRILSIIEYNKEIFAVFFIISILITILLIFETRTNMPWYQQCWYLFGLLFMVSIPWEWFRLYRKEFAEKQSELIKEIPNHCVPKNMTITERMSLWMTGLLSWSTDECIKFQEAILVDPMWEVSPSLALSTTATRLIFKPLEYIAYSCGKSLNAFLGNIPPVWQPVMVILLTVILLLLILLLTKSRIKFGFFEIGPGVAHARLPGQDIDALRNCIRQEMRNVIHRDVAPLREGNLEELQPRICAALQEERRHVPRGVRETESPSYDVPTKTNPAM